MKQALLTIFLFAVCGASIPSKAYAKNCPYDRMGTNYSKNKRCTCVFQWHSGARSKVLAFRKLRAKCTKHKGRLFKVYQRKVGNVWYVGGFCKFKSSSRVISHGYARVINIRKHYPQTWWTSNRSCAHARQTATRACYGYISKYKPKHKGGRVRKLGGKCIYNKRSTKKYGYAYGPMCFYVKPQKRGYYCRVR